MKKVRGEYSEGSTAVRPVESLEMEFDVGGKDVILIDDMIAGGGTMIRAIKECRKKGAKSVVCCATHGLLLGSALADMLGAGASKVAVSDTILTSISKVPIKAALGKFL